MCAQMPMYPIAHGGCTDTVREPALEESLHSGRKVPCRTGDSNRRQYCARLFNQTLHQVSYPHKLQALVYLGGGDSSVVRAPDS